MNKIITKDVLKDTEYSTWYDFHASIFETTSTANDKHRYLFHVKNKERNIELEVSPKMIEQLARLELQSILDKFDLKDPHALAELIKKGQKGLLEKFHLELVEKDEDGEIILNQYQLSLKIAESFKHEVEPTNHY